MTNGSSIPAVWLASVDGGGDCGGEAGGGFDHRVMADSLKAVELDGGPGLLEPFGHRSHRYGVVDTPDDGQRGGVRLDRPWRNIGTRSGGSESSPPVRSRVGCRACRPAAAKLAVLMVVGRDCS